MVSAILLYGVPLLLGVSISPSFIFSMHPVRWVQTSLRETTSCATTQRAGNSYTHLPQTKNGRELFFFFFFFLKGSAFILIRTTHTETIEVDYMYRTAAPCIVGLVNK